MLKEIEEKMGIKDFYLKSYVRLLSGGNISTVLKTSFHSETIWNVPRLFVLYQVSEAVPLRTAQSWSRYGQIAVYIIYMNDLNCADELSKTETADIHRLILYLQ